MDTLIVTTNGGPGLRDRQVLLRELESVYAYSTTADRLPSRDPAPVP